MKYHTLFILKTRKIVAKSSAAVVFGALRVKTELFKCVLLLPLLVFRAGSIM